MKSLVWISGSGLLLLASGTAFAQTMPGSNPFQSKQPSTAMADEQQDKGLDRVRTGFEGQLPTRLDGAVTKASVAVITVGAQVRDRVGHLLGTIDAVDSTDAVVDTGKSKVRVSLTAFGKDNSGLLLGVTAARFNEIVAKAYASNAAAAPAPAKTGPRPATAADVVVGAQLRDVNGQPIGQVEAVAADGATIDVGQHKVKLPISSFGVGSSGLKIPITAQKLNEIIAKSESSASKK